MKQELVRNIFSEDHVKKLIPKREEGRKVSYPFELFGVECGDGWANIIKEALSLIANEAIREQLNTQIHQIKEKFGGLRIYLSSETDYMSGVIRMAEAMAFITCEICGKPGEMTSRGGWMKTLCKDCYNDWK